MVIHKIGTLNHKSKTFALKVTWKCSIKENGNSQIKKELNKDKFWHKIFFSCSCLLNLIRSCAHMYKRCTIPS